MALTTLSGLLVTPSLTEEGRAEYQALRAEIVERLRAQQQVTNYVVLLITGVVAGVLALAGRMEIHVVGSFLGETALLPLTLSGLLFAALAAVFTEHEVMVAFAGSYIARVLRMPWEHASHGRPRNGRELASKVLMGTLFAGKYLLAMAPALLAWSTAAVGVAGAPGLWGYDTATPTVWASRALWLGTSGLLLACLAGVVAAVRRYWLAGEPTPGRLVRRPRQGGEGEHTDELAPLTRLDLVSVRRAP